MTDLQELRYNLYKETNSIEEAKKVYDFITKYDEADKRVINHRQAQAQTDDALQDGVYIVQTDGKAILFRGDNTILTDESFKGVGIKCGSRSLVVALHDMADGEEITLTKCADKTNADVFYKDSYLDAVADWAGILNTEHLTKIGLNVSIKLEKDWYIPSLGEMYFIYTNLREVNAALRFIDKDEIAQDWYWTSTEYSAGSAWGLNLSSGYADYSTKASGKLRVRAVSAFIS